MKMEELREKVLNAFRSYYNVQEEVEDPFFAEAVFHSHDEQYFLIKAARISEFESHEYVFFAERESLTRQDLEELDRTAWERGISRVKPHKDHRNTDVTLIVLCEKAEEEAMKAAAGMKHSQSYKYGLQGYSHYRLVVAEVSGGRMTANRQGKGLLKLLNNTGASK